ncbi:MAG: DNA alkylation repair protein [Acidobacteria bacterium]|nr:DNA alkylation repair protein [Acidobacteriota bacterium]
MYTGSKSLDNYCIVDIFSFPVSQTARAREKMEQWIGSSHKFIGQAGWNLLAHLAMKDQELPDGSFEAGLEVIEQQIHSRLNCVWHAMNGALIEIGMRNPKLQEKATLVARNIGKVKVDHGKTSCQTPDAGAYILKAAQGKRRQQVCGFGGKPSALLGFQAVRRLTLHESAERGSCRRPLL